MKKINGIGWQEWVAALRSGDYTQTEGSLNDGEGFCCLGVLCNLIDSDGWFRSGISGYGWTAGDGIPNPSVHILGPRSRSRNVTAKGLPDNYPLIILDGATTAQRLANMNDEGYTFEEIADYIEECVMNIEQIDG